jgi:hypothetical protein
MLWWRLTCSSLCSDESCSDESYSDESFTGRPLFLGHRRLHRLADRDWPCRLSTADRIRNRPVDPPDCSTSASAAQWLSLTASEQHALLVGYLPSDHANGQSEAAILRRRTPDFVCSIESVEKRRCRPDTEISRTCKLGSDSRTMHVLG